MVDAQRGRAVTGAHGVDEREGVLEVRVRHVQRDVRKLHLAPLGIDPDQARLENRAEHGPNVVTVGEDEILDVDFAHLQAGPRRDRRPAALDELDLPPRATIALLGPHPNDFDAVGVEVMQINRGIPSILCFRNAAAGSHER